MTTFLELRRWKHGYVVSLATMCVLFGTLGLADVVQAQQGPTDDQKRKQRTTNWLTAGMKGVDSFWKRKWMQVAQKAISDDQVEGRKKLTEASQELLQKYHESQVFWRSPVVDEYLQRALLEVHPQTTIPGWGGSIKIRVMKASVPNAMALYDGTIVFSTGLLAELRSKDELLAIIAHEVAHLAEDHSYESYESRKDREKLAKVLGTVAGAVAGVALGASAAEEGASTQEATNIATGMMASSIFLADNVAEAVGAKYSRDQEEEADRLAQAWIMQSSVRVSALASALRRVERASVVRGRASKQTFMSTHPSYGDRLSNLLEVAGEDSDLKKALKSTEPDSVYDRQFAPLLEREAEYRINDGRHEGAIDLLNRVINAEYAAPRTYLLKTIALRHARDTESSNREAVDLLAAYEQGGGEKTPRYYLELGLINMRLQENEKAANAFQKCAEGLTDAEDSSLIDMRRRAEAMSKRLSSGTAGGGDS